jgi:hypothetical protein
MSSKDIDLIRCPASNEILTYCYTSAAQHRLTLADGGCSWSVQGLPPTETPFNLVIEVVQPKMALLKLCFTRDQIQGYATGQSKAEVQKKIETRLKDFMKYFLY